MLLGVLRDLQRIPELAISTTWAKSLGPFPLAGIEVELMTTSEEEALVFETFSRNADQVLVIAPETDGHLARRVRALEHWGVLHLGCHSSAIELTADKLRLAAHWQHNGLPTIPTHLVSADSVPNTSDFPVVVKRRDGAGSQEMALHSNHEEWKRWIHSRGIAKNDQSWIWQPYQPGLAVSVSILVDKIRENYLPLPVAEQSISAADRFLYHGGSLPARLENSLAVQELASAACRSIPGLNGYVGIDLIVANPTDKSSPVWLVELNPRLTTSYLGLSEISESNLARLLVFPQQHSELRWKSQPIQFLADGTVITEINREQP